MSWKQPERPIDTIPPSTPTVNRRRGIAPNAVMVLGPALTRGGPAVCELEVAVGDLPGGGCVVD